MALGKYIYLYRKVQHKRTQGRLEKQEFSYKYAKFPFSKGQFLCTLIRFNLLSVWISSALILQYKPPRNMKFGIFLLNHHIFNTAYLS